jgi:hypothetical protein
MQTFISVEIILFVPRIFCSMHLNLCNFSDPSSTVFDSYVSYLCVYDYFESNAKALVKLLAWSIIIIL